MKAYLWTVLLVAVLAVGCQTTETNEPAATTDAPEPVAVAEAPKAAPPSLKLNKSVYAPGEKIVATFAGGPGNSEDWVGILPAGVKPEYDDTGILCWFYVDGSQDGWSSVKSGTVTLDGSSVNEGDEWPLAEGKYDVYFCCCDGYDPLVTPVTITVAKPVPASLKLNKSVYAPGEKIVATFAGGPGNSDDWVGILPSGVKPGPDDTGILCWFYTDGSQDGWSGVKSGTVTLDGSSVNEGDEWPLAEGKYDVYFCCCEGYDPLTTPVTITVTAKP